MNRNAALLIFCVSVCALSCFALAPVTVIPQEPNLSISLADIQNSKVLEIFTNGGTSEVHRIQTPQKGRAIVKWQDTLSDHPEHLTQLFEKEASTYARLQGIPGILKIYTIAGSEHLNPFIGTYQGNLFVVLENAGQAISLEKKWRTQYYEENSNISKPSLLYREIRKIRSLSRTISQLKYSMQSAHARHTIHMDLKPQNILEGKKWKIEPYSISSKGIWVIDWGMAIRTDTEYIDSYPSLQDLLTKDLIAGTPSYFSPEEFIRIGGIQPNNPEQHFINRDFWAASQTVLELIMGVPRHEPPSIGTSALSNYMTLREEKLGLADTRIKQWFEDRPEAGSLEQNYTSLNEIESKYKIHATKLHLWMDSQLRTKLLGPIHPKLLAFFQKAFHPCPDMRYQSWQTWNHDFQLGLVEEWERIQKQRTLWMTHSMTSNSA